MGTFKYDESVDNVDKVIVYGLDGNDDIKVHKNIGVMAWLFGGNGNDKIRGGDEDDMLVGGDGDDKLDGKRGRDVLIGGLGADKLRGDHGEDILIAAATAYDNNLASLVGIHQQWQVRDAYGQGDGEDTDDVIARTTIIRDTYFGGGVLGGAKDELKGGHDADWLIGMDGEDKFKDDSDDLFGLDNDWFDLD